MKITYGMSKEGNTKAALRAVKEPSAILFFVTKEEELEKTAQEIESYFPGIPSIGAVGSSYGNKDTLVEGVTVVALSDGIEAVANVLEEADRRPVKYIRRLEADIDKIEAVEGQTACFDICCAGTDMKSITTLNSLLSARNIELAGGTSDSQTIAANGKVYANGCAYLLLKNQNGRIKAYKENMYRPMEDERMRLLVTDAVPHDYKLRELDGKPAGQVYRDILGITKEEAATQTFKNPFGHILGTETYIISIKDIDEEGNVTTFRPTNTLDILTIMERDDFRSVADNTVERMKEDLGSVSGVLSVNCLFRYIMFHDQEDFWDEYLSRMSRDFQHAGFIGVGEHYCSQFVNQTMCGLAFE